MTLIAAQSFLLSDRLDWRTPHLRWFKSADYRRSSWKKTYGKA